MAWRRITTTTKCEGTLKTQMSVPSRSTTYHGQYSNLSCQLNDKPSWPTKTKIKPIHECSYSGSCKKNARRHNQRLSINSPAPHSSNVDNIVDENQFYMIGRFFARSKPTNTHQHWTLGERGRWVKFVAHLVERAFFSHDPVHLENIIRRLQKTSSHARFNHGGTNTRAMIFPLVRNLWRNFRTCVELVVELIVFCVELVILKK